MRLRGLSGSKKLQDLFTDAKIPAAERRRLPVLVEEKDEGRLLAVLGLRACESALSEVESRIFSAETLVVTYIPAGE
jgi:tRNA(Ile)-lysidine synthase